MSRAQDILTALDSRRRSLRMSCAALARRSGLSTRTVQRLLQGGADTANLSSVIAIAQALGTDIDLASGRPPAAVREEQARRKAQEIAALAQGSAALECQGVSRDTRDLVEQRIAAGLLVGSSVRLWGE